MQIERSMRRATMGIVMASYQTTLKVLSSILVFHVLKIRADSGSFDGPNAESFATAKKFFRQFLTE
jgi:hypothetical protein